MQKEIYGLSDYYNGMNKYIGLVYKNQRLNTKNI
jgi:hypothetical protein